MSTAVLRDTGTVLRRELRPILRDPFSVIFSMIQPLFFLALFGPLVVGVDGPGRAGLAAVVRAGDPRDVGAVRRRR